MGADTANSHFGNPMATGPNAARGCHGTSCIGTDAMNSKRSLRFFSKTMTAVGLTLAVSACATVYEEDWDQTSDVPDLNQQDQRSQALLDYCKSLHSRGDLNLAAGICNRAHEINPTDPAPLIELARVMESLERKAAAPASA